MAKSKHNKPSSQPRSNNPRASRNNSSTSGSARPTTSNRRTQEVVFSVPSGYPPLQSALATARLLRESQQSNSSSSARSSTSSTRPTFGPSPPPPNSINLDNCTESEMQALMGMFAELMALQPNRSGGVRVSSSMNNTQHASAAATAAALSTVWPTSEALYDWAHDCYPDIYDDYGSEDTEDEDMDEDMEDVDDEEDLQEEEDSRTKSAVQESLAPEPKDLQEEEAIVDPQEKKAAKKREKKQRRKQKLKEEATERAAQAAEVKRKKLIQSWTSRVVSACQSGDAPKVKALWNESPLSLEEEEQHDDLMTQMEFFLPSCIAKTPAHVEQGHEARALLTNHVLKHALPVLFGMTKNGRNALHTAAFVGDYYFWQTVTPTLLEKEKEDVIRQDWQNMVCVESGWTPLHYAVASGSPPTVEALLAAGCCVKARTDRWRTCRLSDGYGITARELAEVYIAGQSVKNNTILKTKGNMLFKLKERCGSRTGRNLEQRKFIDKLRSLVIRLKDVEMNGYTPPENLFQEEEEEELRSNKSQNNASKKKKKKKKKSQSAEPAPAAAPTKTAAAPQKVAAVPKPPEEDPVVTAVLGMGFTREQVDAAFKACGGGARATADDMVMWILDPQSSSSPPESSTTQQPGDNFDSSSLEAPFVETGKGESWEKTSTSSKSSKDGSRHGSKEAAAREEEARVASQRFAAKREEQRRRNREWNNRENARQQEEARVKLAEAMELRARADAHRLALSQSAGAAVLPSTQPPSVPVSVTRSSPVVAPLPTANVAVPAPVALPAASAAAPSANDSQQTEVNATFAPPGSSSKKVMPQPLPPGFAPTRDMSHNAKAAPKSQPMSVLGVNMDNPHVPKTAPQIPPPGFQPPSFRPPAAPALYALADPLSSQSYSSDAAEHLYPTGEIRATAKAFVPSGFPAPRNNAGMGSTMLHSTVPSNDFSLSDHGDNMNNMPDPVSGLFSGETRSHSGSFSGHPTPVSPASPVPSTVSSMTGISALDEAPSLPQAVGFGFGGPTKSEPMPSAAIWGSSMNPPVSSTTAPAIGDFSLGLLGDSLGLGQGTVNQTLSPRRDGEAEHGRAVSGDWGSGFTGTANGLGSIW